MHPSAATLRILVALGVCCRIVCWPVLTLKGPSVMHITYGDVWKDPGYVCVMWDGLKQVHTEIIAETFDGVATAIVDTNRTGTRVLLYRCTGEGASVQVERIVKIRSLPHLSLTRSSPAPPLPKGNIGKRYLLTCVNMHSSSWPTSTAQQSKNVVWR